MHVEVVKIIYRHCASDRLAPWSGVGLSADPSLPDHREREEGVRRDREEGREGADCSEEENRGTEEPPLLAVRWAWQIGWLITALMHLCQQGHLVVPPPLPPPHHCPEDPHRDDYRYDREVRITLLTVERITRWTLMKNRGEKMAEIQQLALFGLSWLAEMFNPSIY